MVPYVMVDGINICDRFHLLWTNDSTLSPPEVKVNVVDVPGMDGSLDLTETLTGDAVYGDRKHELVFAVLGDADFERIKTEMCNMLHGTAHDYELSVDPGYTYRGRWVCDSYHSRMHYREIKFTVTAEPYKRGVHHHYVVQGAGGAYVTVENGRKHVIPVVTVQTPTLIAYEGKSWELGRDGEVGSFTIDGLRLKKGTSTIYVNSAPDYCDTTGQDLEDMYGEMSKCADMVIAEMFVHKTDPPEGAEHEVEIDYDEFEL